MLSNEFYKDYNLSKYPKLEDKSNRPLLVMLIKIEDNIFAMPFRTNVKHNYSYKFAKTNRCTNSSTALDFSKANVITNNKYIGVHVTIDRKEFLKLENKETFIINKFTTFIAKYKRIMKDP